MKKLTYTFISLFAMVLCLAFCSCSKSDPTNLPAPQNLQISQRTLTWDEVENAKGYTVYLDGKEYTTEECCFDLLFLTVPKDYNIEVCALGDWESYSDSEWAETTFTLHEPVEHGYDDRGFEYTLLEDGRGYELSRGNLDQNDPVLEGYLILPDFFGDYPVLQIAHQAFAPPPGSYLVSYINGLGCNRVTTGIRLPAYLESIGAAAFSYMFRLESIVIPDTVTKIWGSAFACDPHLKHVTLPQGLKEIPVNCFEDTALESITLPESLESIGSDAFWCQYSDNPSTPHVESALSSITIPDNVTSIGGRAFAGRDNLKDVTMSSRLEWIEGLVFADTAWYEAQEDGLILLRNDILYGYKGEMPENTVINVPTQVKYIAGNAFQNQDNLTGIYIPDGVKLINEYIFSGCDSLSDVRLPSDLTGIPAGTFSGCKALKTISLPNSIQKINGGFSNSGLESIVIPPLIKVIESNTFARCSALKEVILSEGLESIESDAFAECSSLTSITLPSSLKRIGSHAFDRCVLTEIVIPRSLETFGRQPFERSTTLARVYYEGNVAAWEPLAAQAVNPSNTAAPFSNATVYFYSETEPEEAGNYWHYVDGKPTLWFEESD